MHGAPTVLAFVNHGLPRLGEPGLELRDLFVSIDDGTNERGVVAVRREQRFDPRARLPRPLHRGREVPLANIDAGEPELRLGVCDGVVDARRIASGELREADIRLVELDARAHEVTLLLEDRTDAFARERRLIEIVGAVSDGDVRNCRARWLPSA